MSRRFWSIACIASLAACVASLAACNPDRGPKWKGAGAETPQRGGTLRIAIQDQIKTLDPVVANDEMSTNAIHPLFDTLVDFDDGLELVPHLASSVDHSPDGLVYTFHLRPGIAYEDGRPIVAGDFKYALDRALVLPETFGRQDLGDVVGADDVIAGKTTHCAGIAAPDDTTLVFTLARRNAAFLFVMTMPFTTPQRRDHVEAVGADIRRRPLATGPYKLESWDEGQRLVLVANPHYYTRDRGRIERIEIAENIPRDTQFLMFERSELDAAEKLSAPDYLWVTSQPDWQPFLHRRPLMNAFGSRMNVTVKPFDDVRVRRALNYAFNKDHLAKLLTGTSTPAHGVLPPGMLGRDNDLHPYPHDPVKARALLAEAGYPEGFEVGYLTLNNDDATKVAQSLQSDLAAVGVRVRLSIVTFDAWGAAVTQRTGAPFSYEGWIADYPDPTNFLDAQFATKMIADRDSNNHTFYSNPVLDELLDVAREEQDVAARAAMYRRAERILYDDAPWIFGFHQVLTEITQPYLRGYEPHPVWQRDYTRAWLDLGPDGEPVPR